MSQTESFPLVWSKYKKKQWKGEIWEQINIDLKKSVINILANLFIIVFKQNIFQLLIKKGQVVRKLPESELLSTLREELAHWNDKADE
mgnify:CR=1 FL=1